MIKYIDAEVLKNNMHKCIWTQDMKSVEKFVDGLPAADVEKVCRCEHCSKSAEHPNGRWCRIHQSVVQNSDYCSWGTKR